MKRVFVGYIHGEELFGGPEDGGETAVYSDGDSSAGSIDSLYQVHDGALRGCSDGLSIPDLCESPNWAGVFMAGTQPGQNSTAAAAITSGLGAAGAGGPVRPPAQQIRCIKFKMVCLGAVLMATLFRTLQSRQTGQESSWLVLNSAKILPPQRR